MIEKEKHSKIEEVIIDLCERLPFGCTILEDKGKCKYQACSCFYWTIKEGVYYCWKKKIERGY